jgi:hypothetical protein
MNNEQAARSLASDLLLRAGLDATPVETGVIEYAKTVLDGLGGDVFHVDETAVSGERSVCVLSAEGLDVLRLGQRAASAKQRSDGAAIPQRTVRRLTRG